MSFLPRKLTFQLTPLLDLLLIVIFAQYLEVRQESREGQATLLDRVAAAEDSREQADAALADLKEQNERFRQQEVELTEALKQAAEQRDLVGRLTAELFQIPEELAERALLPKESTGPAQSPDEIAELREQFRALGQKRAGEMVKHLLTYEELRKRADVWDVYLAENGTITFDTGNRTQQFRADTSEHFATQLFQRYKALPQPKSLVVILLSYGNAKALWREAAVNGLRDAAERMRADSSGRTSFEYAILGYRPREPESALP